MTMQQLTVRRITRLEDDGYLATSLGCLLGPGDDALSYVISSQHDNSRETSECNSAANFGVGTQRANQRKEGSTNHSRN